MQNVMDDELLNLDVSRSQTGSGNAISPESIDGSQALEKDNIGLPVVDPIWNLNCEVENYLSQGILFHHNGLHLAVLVLSRVIDIGGSTFLEEFGPCPP
jgi:hypothetical protein